MGKFFSIVSVWSISYNSPNSWNWMCVEDPFCKSDKCCNALCTIIMIMGKIPIYKYTKKLGIFN